MKTVRILKPAKDEDEVTTTWSPKLDKENWVKVPRVLIQLGRHLNQAERQDLKPRHILLLLALASLRFEDKPLRVYWENLGDALGCSKENVRKWGYELKRMGLLNITEVRGRDPEKNKVGYRNEANLFDLGPFVTLLEKAEDRRVKEKDTREAKTKSKQRKNQTEAAHE